MWVLKYIRLSRSMLLLCICVPQINVKHACDLFHNLVVEWFVFKNKKTPCTRSPSYLLNSINQKYIPKNVPHSHNRRSVWTTHTMLIMINQIKEVCVTFFRKFIPLTFLFSSFPPLFLWSYSYFEKKQKTPVPSYVHQIVWTF